MRILITGANGFIARHLIAAAAAQGDEVFALSRSGAPVTGAAQTYAWSLGQLAPPACVIDRQCAIHLAHDFAGAEGAQRTLDGTLALAAQLQAAGFTRQLFFSSCSAGAQATSLYGRTKLALEQSLAGYRGMVIIRPGLVLGAGGIYGRIRYWAQRLPLVPLPDGGSGVVPVIAVEKLCRLTLQLACNAPAARAVNLFEPQLKSLHALVSEAAAEAGRQPRILPIPAGLLLAGLRLAATLRLPLPVNADNLVGFLANQSAQHQSYLAREEQ